MENLNEVLTLAKAKYNKMNKPFTKIDGLRTIERVYDKTLREALAIVRGLDFEFDTDHEAKRIIRSILGH